METMRIWAHEPHIIEDMARHQTIGFAANTWREVPEDIGVLLLQGHPARFCDVSQEAAPDSHQCAKGVYEHRMMVAAVPSVGRPKEHMSPGRRKTLTKAMHGRGRKARIAAREK